MSYFAAVCVVLCGAGQALAQNLEFDSLTFTERWQLGQECARLQALDYQEGGALAWVLVQAGCSQPRYPIVDFRQFDANISEAKRAQLDRSCAVAAQVGGALLAMRVAGCKEAN